MYSLHFANVNKGTCDYVDTFNDIDHARCAAQNHTREMFSKGIVGVCIVVRDNEDESRAVAVEGVVTTGK